MIVEHHHDNSSEIETQQGAPNFQSNIGKFVWKTTIWVEMSIKVNALKYNTKRDHTRDAERRGPRTIPKIGSQVKYQVSFYSPLKTENKITSRKILEFVSVFYTSPLHI